MAALRSVRSWILSRPAQAALVTTAMLLLLASSAALLMGTRRGSGSITIQAKSEYISSRNYCATRSVELALPPGRIAAAGAEPDDITDPIAMRVSGIYELSIKRHHSGALRIVIGPPRDSSLRPQDEWKVD